MRRFINKENIYHGLIMGLVVIQLLSLVLSIDFTLLDSIIALSVLILGIKNLSRSFQIATLIFFIAGILLLSTTGITIHSTGLAIKSMVNIVVLLVIMQLFLIPVTVGNYQAAVEEFMQKHVHGPKATYTFVMLVTHLLSSILSMGTVAIVLSILGDSIKRQVKDSARFSATSVTRAFTLGTLWAPGAATIFLISTVTGVGWSKLFIPCLLLGIVGLILAYVMERNQSYMKEKPSESTIVSQTKLVDHASLVSLVLAVVALLTLSFIFMEVKVASSMDSVTLAGLLTVIIWIILLSQRHSQNNLRFKSSLKKAAVSYWHHGIGSGAALAPFFVGIGTFTYGFQHSSVIIKLTSVLSPVFARFGWLLVVLIPIIVVIVSLIGIHPLASVALIGKVIMAMHLTLSPLLIALSLNIGSVAAYMLSPFAGIVMIVATILNVKPTQVSIRWNWKFYLAFMVVDLVFASVLSFIF